jgi:membrane associated rhomboid family serine protease
VREDNGAVGIYDRDYYHTREQQPSGLSLHAPRTIVGALIAVNIALWLADFIIPASLLGGERLTDWMGVHVSTLTSPWLWWEYLTAGFAHSPNNYNHIVGNMLGLFFLGRDVEATYGRKEFLRVYLAMVIFASIVWNVANFLAGPPGALIQEVGIAAATAIWQNIAAYGASGAIAGVVVLYALNFPQRTLLLFFVIPMPAWLLGVGLVVWDALGATGRAGEPNIAYSMHLAGAAFAFVYYHRGWNLTQLTSGRIPWPKFNKPPRLRVHTPPEDEHTSNLSEEVDHILEKIYREGEASLTAKERKTLETASREYQRKVQTGGRDSGKRR